MNDKEFKDFCYDQYKIELDDAERMYQKISILIGVLALLFGVAAKLFPLALLSSHKFSIPLVLLMIFSIAALVLLTISLLYLIHAGYPRDYQRIAPTQKWEEWRQKCLQHYAKNCTSDEELLKTVNAEFSSNFIKSLANAQCINVPVNELRGKSYQRAMLFSVVSLAAILLMAICRVMLFVGA